MGADWSTADLVRRLADVTVVEALGPSYFANGHIPGAVNIPPHRVTELAAVVLPEKAEPLVVYGAGRHSPGADVVAPRLTMLGYRDVSRYRDGKQGWAEAGLPLVGDTED